MITTELSSVVHAHHHQQHHHLENNPQHHHLSGHHGGHGDQQTVIHMTMDSESHKKKSESHFCNQLTKKYLFTDFYVNIKDFLNESNQRLIYAILLYFMVY